MYVLNLNALKYIPGMVYAFKDILHNKKYNSRDKCLNTTEHWKMVMKQDQSFEVRYYVSAPE
jgi:hypothetical protein